MDSWLCIFYSDASVLEIVFSLDAIWETIDGRGEDIFQLLRLELEDLGVGDGG